MLHFIGIGGIGMSALARIALQKGLKVSGSDLSHSAVIELLISEGAEVSIGHEEKNIQSGARVVYSSDIKENNPEFSKARKEQNPMFHRSEFLGELMRGTKPLLVTGTHGKTTTSSLLAHVLISAGLDPSFALGGIPTSLGSNGGHGKGAYFVAEADESDGSFLKYPGFGAIITNLEDDHMNYWKTHENLVRGFQTFSLEKELLVWCHDDHELCGLKLGGFSYGFDPKSSAQILKWRQEGWKLFFDLCFKDHVYADLEIPLLGKHNVLNATAVFVMAMTLGVSEQAIRAAFKSFQGVKRRLEKRCEIMSVEIYDDYGHHPTEIQATLKAVKRAIGEKRLVVVFQPHRYTRTQECFDEFVKSFDAADVVVLTDIYSAREAPIPGITGESLFQAVGRDFFFNRENLSVGLEAILRPHDVLVTMGAGDITGLADKIQERNIRPLKVALITGGASTEHEVAISSATTLTPHFSTKHYNLKTFFISREGIWEKSLPEIVAELVTYDVIFPMVHGQFCEDGMLQGFFETLQIPYAGPDYRSGAVTMDKAWTKRIAMSYGISSASFVELGATEWEKDPMSCIQKIESQIKYPLFVKPVHLGSTIGVFRVKNRGELELAIEKICNLDYKLIAEEEITGREMEFGLIGTDDIIVSKPAEVVTSHELYTYEDKYGEKAINARLKAEIPPDVEKEGQKIAKTVYQACGCTGLARIDFFLRGDEWILNEVNPIPGFTPTSVYPKLWPAEGISLSTVIDKIIISALYRKRRQDAHLL
jgi:UDP-N-acetylmuramate--alanine ligase